MIYFPVKGFHIVHIPNTQTKCSDSPVTSSSFVDHSCQRMSCVAKYKIKTPTN